MTHITRKTYIRINLCSFPLRLNLSRTFRIVKIVIMQIESRLGKLHHIVPSLWTEISNIDSYGLLFARSDYKYIICAGVYLSHLVIARPLRSVTANNVAEFLLRDIFCIFPIPESIFRDVGCNFISKQIQESSTFV